MKHWNKIDWLFLSSVCEPFFVFRYVWGDKKLKLQDRSTNYVKTKARWTRLPTRILSMLTWICYKISLRTPKIFQNSAIHICTTICIHHLILGIFAICAKPFWLPIENSTCQNIKKITMVSGVFKNCGWPQILLHTYIEQIFIWMKFSQPSQVGLLVALWG